MVLGHCVSGSVGKATASPAASAAGCGQIGGISGHDVGATGQTVAIGGTNFGRPRPPPPVPEVVDDGSLAFDDSSLGRSSSLLSRFVAMDSSPLRWMAASQWEGRGGGRVEVGSGEAEVTRRS